MESQVEGEWKQSKRVFSGVSATNKYLMMKSSVEYDNTVRSMM
jgi:hypothetical protein